MSSGRRTDERDGRAILLLWRPGTLPEEDGELSDEDRDETELGPQWCMAAGCIQPLASRFYGYPIFGYDRASCGTAGRGGRVHRWTIRWRFLCASCHLAELEREVGAGWTPRSNAGADRRRTGRRQGDWDD